MTGGSGGGPTGRPVATSEWGNGRQPPSIRTWKSQQAPFQAQTDTRSATQLNVPSTALSGPLGPGSGADGASSHEHVAA